MGLKIKLVKTTGPSFLTSFRSHCGSVSPCITMCDLILTGPKGKKGKCCQGYPIRHYGVQLGVGIASGEGQLIGLAANRRRS